MKRKRYAVSVVASSWVGGIVNSIAIVYAFSKNEAIGQIYDYYKNVIADEKAVGTMLIEHCECSCVITVLKNT